MSTPDGTSCVCKDGTISKSSMPNLQCIECPSAVTCQNGSVVVASGYWQQSAESFNVYACPNSAACPGGGSSCNTGYSGVVCGVCSSGYSHVALSCEQCPQNNSVNVFLLFLTTTVIIVFCFFYIGRQLREDAHRTIVAMTAKQLIHYLQLVSVFGGTLTSRCGFFFFR